MKIEVHNEAKTFQPIKLTLTIESEDELKGLWGRMNLGSLTINDNNTNKDMRSDWQATEIWRMIDQLCKDRALR